MTGREIIIYILNNKLENDVVYFPVEDMANNLIDVYQAATKFNVGVSTIRTWYKIGVLKGVEVGTTLLILKNAPDPRKEKKE